MRQVRRKEVPEEVSKALNKLRRNVQTHKYYCSKS